MRIYSHLLFVFLTCNVCFAQQDSITVHYDETKLQPHKITEEDLSDYRKNKDFNYVETVEDDSIAKKIKRWLVNILTRIFEAIFGIGSATGILKFIFNVLPYILLGVLVYLLIKFFLKVNSRQLVLGEQKKASVSFSNDEHIINNEDISLLIENAVKDHNYRLAIRYYYLLVLKELSENGMIQWELQKTNEDYVNEIKNQELQLNFINITRIYDYVWYGGFTVDALKFSHLKKTFEALSNSKTTD